MPLNLDSSSSEEQFHNKLRFKATAGLWWINNDGEEKRFNDGFTAIFDFENVETGWSKYNGSFTVFVADPDLQTVSARPSVEGDDDEEWKRAFRVNVYSKDAFGGTGTFLHAARCVTAAFKELYAEYEGKAKNGQVPVVEVDGSPKKIGDYYAPNWSIAKMTKRPEAMLAEAEGDEEF